LDGQHIIRFWFNSDALAKVVFPFIKERTTSYGAFTNHGQHNVSNTTATPQKVVVEFSSPNIGPEFNGTHLRSTLLGALVSNIYETMGWNVTRINYLGDWGKELAFLALGFQKFGSEEKLQADPLSHMVDVYTQMKELSKPQQEELRRAKDEGRSTADIESTGILAERDAFCQSLENGEEEPVNLWKRFRELAIDQLDQ
jgi:arginyl-tRNA synthetase